MASKRQFDSTSPLVETKSAPRNRTYHLTQVLPRCPECKSTKLKPYDYRRHPEIGVTTKYCKCCNCGVNVNIDVS
jgi:hypothetical protein